jgi:N-acyl-D-amino-acid deacylase
MIGRISLVFLLTLASMTAFTSVSSKTPEYDLIIRNGRVIDGSGRRAFPADVAIKGDHLARIGNLRGAQAKRVIDAHGQIVAPGFIDMLGQSEQFVLIDPRAMSKVMMGVTTEITGEGESIAPINDRILKEQEDFNRRYNLTVDWRTLAEYFQRLEKQGAGVNLGTFVGATQVREYVIGYDDRPPTPAELQQMKTLVADAMKDGALGVSTSLQYVPARFAKTDEIVELARVAHQYGGIYITHQRSEANAIDDSMKEVFEIARRARIPAEIWHFKTAYKKNWGPHAGNAPPHRDREEAGTQDHRRRLSLRCRQHFSECLSAAVGARGRNGCYGDALEGSANPRAAKKGNNNGRQRMGEHLSRQWRAQRNHDRVRRESRSCELAGQAAF